MLRLLSFTKHSAHTTHNSHNITFPFTTFPSFDPAGFLLYYLSPCDARETESFRFMCYRISVKRLGEYFEYTTCVVLFGTMTMFVYGMWQLLLYLVLLDASRCQSFSVFINPLNPELNPICYLLALLGAHHFLHVSRIRVKLLTFRLLMSYIYGAPILDVSRSHTTTQHSR